MCQIECHKLIDYNCGGIWAGRSGGDWRGYLPLEHLCILRDGAATKARAAATHPAGRAPPRASGGRDRCRALAAARGRRRHETTRYARAAQPYTVLFPEVCDRNAVRVIERFGRENLMLENKLIRKYKASWGMSPYALRGH